MSSFNEGLVGIYNMAGISLLFCLFFSVYFINMKVPHLSLTFFPSNAQLTHLRIIIVEYNFINMKSIDLISKEGIKTNKDENFISIIVNHIYLYLFLLCIASHGDLHKVRHVTLSCHSPSRLPSHLHFLLTTCSVACLALGITVWITN